MRQEKPNAAMGAGYSILLNVKQTRILFFAACVCRL